MSPPDLTAAAVDPVPSIAGATALPAPVRAPRTAQAVGPLAWVRVNLFGTWWSTAVTLLLGYAVLRLLYGFVSWAVVNAVWAVPHTDTGAPQTDVCRAARGIGACWAVVPEKFRYILFGTYTYDQQWRPAVCVLLFLALYAVSAMRRFWRKELVLVWVATLIVIAVLMFGGVLGLPEVSEDLWGGLPITLLLSTFGLALAFPLAILTALGRRSRAMPAVRTLCIVYVELIRGVPLVSLLFMANVMFPLFLPAGVTIDKLLRVQVAIILFAGAYLSEVVRAGLQALPRGQYEAADALGLSYWRKTGLIVLPQALRVVIPPLVNTFIGFFKDTSLVLIVGLFDLMYTGRTAILEPAWQGFGNEIYLVLAVMYFAFCFAMSSYSRNLEREFSQSRRR